MPQARLPNASLIANTDSLLLPFLAPSAFAESPILQRRSLYDGKSRGAQKETEKTNLKQCVIQRPCCEGGAQTNLWSIKAKSKPEPKLERKFAVQLQMTTQPRKPFKTLVRPSPVDLLYADISSFARQQARAYSRTGSSVGRPVVREVASTRRVSRLSDRITSAKPVSSILAPHSAILAARREQALMLEKERFANYISRLPHGLSAKERLARGQYRSLRRRITNLQSWDTTQVDLRRMRGSLENMSGFIQAFAALDRVVYPQIRRHTRKMNILHDAHCVKMSGELFQLKSDTTTHEVWNRWIAYDLNTRKRYFQRLLIYLLDRRPSRALQFIQVLANDPLLRDRRTESIADALDHLCKVHKDGIYPREQAWGRESESQTRNFVPAFVHLFQNRLAGQPEVCSQELFYNLVGLCSTEDLKKVFDCLVEASTWLNFDTVLHYANAFGTAGEIQYALRCLDELRKRNNTEAWKSVVDRERLRWTCAVILRSSMRTNQEYHQTPVVVAAFVRLRIKMDILLYNVVMHNAMEAHDYATAFKVFNTLESHGLVANKHTYSILLHGCTTQNHPRMFQDFAQYCAKVAKEEENAWLATDYLYYLYACHHNDPDARRTSALLWQAYMDFFSVAPLRPFAGQRGDHLTTTIDQQESSPHSTIIQPTQLALYIMLQIEIQMALSVSHQRVLNLYELFKLTVSEGGSPILTELAKNPIIWNAFLYAFCKRKQFANASQLIKDMTEGPAPPNIYSWNIFMQAFFNEGQVKAADRVFDILRQRGVEPDQYTYGVMLRGYAKAQMVERIGETMQFVDADQEMDTDMLRALSKVMNRNRLMYTLEASRVQKDANLKEATEKAAEEKRLRWNAPEALEFLLETPSSVIEPSEGEVQSTINHELVWAVEQSAVNGEDSESAEKELFSFLKDEPLPTLKQPSSASQDKSSVSPPPRGLSRRPLAPHSLPGEKAKGPTSELASGSTAAIDSSDPKVPPRLLHEEPPVPPLNPQDQAPVPPISKSTFIRPSLVPAPSAKKINHSRPIPGPSPPANASPVDPEAESRLYQGEFHSLPASSLDCAPFPPVSAVNFRLPSPKTPLPVKASPLDPEAELRLLQDKLAITPGSTQLGLSRDSGAEFKSPQQNRTVSHRSKRSKLPRDAQTPATELAILPDATTIANSVIPARPSDKPKITKELPPFAIIKVVYGMRTKNKQSIQGGRYGKVKELPTHDRKRGR